MHSHAYGKVAKNRPSLTRPRHAAPVKRQSIAGYRDSMVGSIAQYRDAAPLPPRAPEAPEGKQPDAGGVIGNRPASTTASEAAPRRHHFVEPPKRSFHRFD